MRGHRLGLIGAACAAGSLLALPAAAQAGPGLNNTTNVCIDTRCFRVANQMLGVFEPAQDSKTLLCALTGVRTTVVGQQVLLCRSAAALSSDGPLGPVHGDAEYQSTPYTCGHASPDNQERTGQIILRGADHEIRLEGFSNNCK